MEGREPSFFAVAHRPSGPAVVLSMLSLSSLGGTLLSSNTDLVGPASCLPRVALFVHFSPPPSSFPSQLCKLLTPLKKAHLYLSVWARAPLLSAHNTHCIFYHCTWYIVFYVFTGLFSRIWNFWGQKPCLICLYSPYLREGLHKC